jgi:membrane-bound serine protease (ClpP class)
LVFIIAFGKRIFESSVFRTVSDVGEMSTAQGFSIRNDSLHSLIGATGVAATNLRPAGRIEIAGELYDSIADGSFISKGEEVKVIRVQSRYLVVQ